MNRKRLSDYGIRVGCMPTGPLDKITDVPGVTVGHATVRDARHHTGVTVIMPCEDNMFAKKPRVLYSTGLAKRRGLCRWMSWARWKRPSR